MINLIGAFIFTIWLVAVFQKRREIIETLVRFEDLSAAVKTVLAALLGWMLVLQAGLIDPTTQNFWAALPQYVFNALNLWMHEAGHIYWRFLGSFFMSFGGTLNELLFPSLLLVWSSRRRLHLTAAISWWWLSFNLYSIARYAGDARAKALPLITGDSSGHDWANMLDMLGMLEYDAQISQVFATLATLFAVVALYRLFSPGRQDTTSDKAPT